MLDLEQLLSDLRGLENELDGMGVEAVLDERDDGMPDFNDDIDLTDLRDALLKEYPLDKYPPEEGE